MEHERIRNLTVKNLTVTGSMTGPASGLTSSPAASGPKSAGGKTSITGSGIVASGLTAITAVVVCLGQDASLAAIGATATWSGTNITIKVTRPTSNLDCTPVASTAATVVNWIAIGS